MPRRGSITAALTDSAKRALDAGLDVVDNVKDAAEDAAKSGLVEVGLSSGDEVSWGESRIRRVGVPGGQQLNLRQSTRFIFRWKGTAFKAALTSIATILHIILLGAFCVFARYLRIDHDINVREVLLVDEEVTNALTFVFSFVIATYIAFVVERFDSRISTCLEVNDACARVVLNLSVEAPDEQALVRQCSRYILLMLHLYYLKMDSPMSEGKWTLCKNRGLITSEEVVELDKLRDAPAAVYIWAFEIIHEIGIEGKITEEAAEALKDTLSNARALAQRQKDLHACPIPMPFFHLMTILSHAYLLVLEWNAAVRFTDGMNTVFGDGDGGKGDEDMSGDWMSGDAEAETNVAGAFLEALASFGRFEVAFQMRYGDLFGALVMIVAVNALRRIAFAMTNPFGDDETDYELDYDLRRLGLLFEETTQRMGSAKERRKQMSIRAEAAKERREIEEKNIKWSNVDEMEQVWIEEQVGLENWEREHGVSKEEEPQAYLGRRASFMRGRAQVGDLSALSIRKPEAPTSGSEATTPEADPLSRSVEAFKSPVPPTTFVL